MNPPVPEFSLRCAREEDAPALEQLIDQSTRGLLSRYYSAEQLVAALGPVFGLDRQLIRDRTYFVVERQGSIVACGGWSRRRAVYGGDRHRPGQDAELSPGFDPARVRAFFVAPECVRRGLGRLLLEASEKAIQAAGFKCIELVATLAGEPLYAAHGYRVVERENASLPGDLSLATVRMTKTL